MKIGKNWFRRLVQKKCGVCFDGAYATKKIVPRWHITLQPMYRYATCCLGSCAQMVLTATKVLYFNNFCPLPPRASSGTPTVNLMRWRQGAYRSSLSAFLTHVSTNLGPVKPIALLKVWKFIKAWCRHVAFGYRAVARCRTWVLTAVFVYIFSVCLFFCRSL